MEVIFILNKIVEKIITTPFINKKYIKTMRTLDSTPENNCHNALFFWIPKTGGTSIYSVLSNYGCQKILKPTHFHKFNNKGVVTFGHVNVSDLLDTNVIESDFFSRAFKFTFVRNPYDRFVSLYFYFLKTGKLSNKCSFKDFAEYIYINGIEPIGMYNVKGYSQCQPQLEWITNSKGEIIVDFIGKFESLNVDFSVIKHNLDIEGFLPHKNKTSHNHYREYYDDETIEYVSGIYKEDIEYFNYKF